MNSRIGEVNYNKFGSKMSIIEYRNAKDIDVYFEEYKWIYKHSRYTHFKEGNIICPYERRFRGIGYLGEGNYTFRVGNKETRYYHEWMKILERCYSSKWLDKYNTYLHCEVCEEWHNFQNFAKWYETNYYEIDNERMELDKDIINKGNKIYSPQTCIFVPQRINKLFTKSNKIRGQYPIGVYYNQTDGKFWSQLSYINEKGKKDRKLLGRFDTPLQAFEVYKQEKERYIKEVADEYKDLIPTELYNAMYRYEVEIND